VRGFGVLFLLLLAIVAGMVWAITWGPLRDISIVRTPNSGAVQPVASQTAPPPQSTPPPKARGAGGSTKEGGFNSPAGAATAEQAPAAVVTPSKPVPPPRFPTAADVPLGTLGSSIQDSFGPPDARTIAVDDRGRVEILIYRRTRPDTATQIHLRNGRVVSAVTTAY
jgi:hypothetical protein